MPQKAQELPVIHTDPTKEFFVDMLTKDISLGDCVLDLLDNSIQSLIRQAKLNVMNTLQGKPATSTPFNASVAIGLSRAKFTIRDNCGGISIREAIDSTFRLGNPSPDTKRPGLGVYGIGMKRAMFKIGNLIKVDSRTIADEFGFTLDVEAWKNDTTTWDFPVDYARQRTSPTASTGTTIEITSLAKGAQRAFEQPSFKTEHVRRISTVHGLFLQAGLAVTVNNTAAKPLLPAFGESDDVATAKKTFTHDGVDVLILAGITPRTDRTPRGWYVFCNGRLVLEADQTWTTGWDDNMPVFHPKYNHFLGFVYFRSNDVTKLPWKTTKEGVERDSDLFRKTLAEMRIIARPVLNFLNAMYPSDIVPEGVAEREAHDAATPVSAEQVATKRTASPTFTAKTKKRPENALVNILYRRPTKDVDRIRRAIGRPKMSATKIGEYTFDVFLQRECD